MYHTLIFFCILFSDVVFSTAHKAKGLEYDHVRVAGDFLLSLTNLGLGKLTAC